MRCWKTKTSRMKNLSASIIHEWEFSIFSHSRSFGIVCDFIVFDSFYDPSISTAFNALQGNCNRGASSKYSLLKAKNPQLHKSQVSSEFQRKKNHSFSYSRMEVFRFKSFSHKFFLIPHGMSTARNLNPLEMEMKKKIPWNIQLSFHVFFSTNESCVETRIKFCSCTPAEN